MSEPEAASPTPNERVRDLPRMLAAMQQAVREALARHKRAGNPIATWRDGRVVWIEPQDIPVDLPVEGYQPGHV
jgi:hypothetical protein